MPKFLLTFSIDILFYSCTYVIFVNLEMDVMNCLIFLIFYVLHIIVVVTIIFKQIKSHRLDVLLK